MLELIRTCRKISMEVDERFAHMNFRDLRKNPSLTGVNDREWSAFGDVVVKLSELPKEAVDQLAAVDLPDLARQIETLLAQAEAKYKRPRGFIHRR